MRNVHVVNNQSKKRLKYAGVLMLVVFILMLMVVIVAGVDRSQTKIENIEAVQGQVEEVVKDENNNYRIKLDGEYYYIQSVVGKHIEDEEIALLQGQQATLYVLSTSVSGESLVGIESAVYNLDQKESIDLILQDSLANLIATSVLAGAFLVCAVAFFAMIPRAREYIRGDVFKLINQLPRNPSKIYAPYLKGFGWAGLTESILSIVLLVYLIGDIYNTAFYVILGIFLAVMLAMIISYLLIMPKLKAKESKEFVKYFSYDFSQKNEEERSSLVMDYGNMLCFNMEEEGLHYKQEYGVEVIYESVKSMGKLNDLQLQEFKENLRNAMQKADEEEEQTTKKKKNKKDYFEYAKGSSLLEDTVIKYNEVRFTTQVCYRPTTNLMSIFIVSHFLELEYPTLKNDLFLEVTDDALYFIKKYNVRVEGLDYCIENCEKLIKEHCKGGVKYFEYSDSGEKELFTERVKLFKSKEELRQEKEG